MQIDNQDLRFLHKGYPFPDRTRVGRMRVSTGKSVARPTDWGNPYEIEGKMTREKVIGEYFKLLWSMPSLVNRLHEFDGVDTLLCWCYPRDCHGDVIAAFVDVFPITAYNPMVSVGLVKSDHDGRWACRIGFVSVRGFDLYSTVRVTLETYQLKKKPE